MARDRHDDECAATEIKRGSSLGPLRETEVLAYRLGGGLDQGDPRLAVELRVASGVVPMAVGMRNQNAQIFPGGPLPLTDQVANDAIERKAICFCGGAGVLDENGVVTDQDINEGSLKMNALVLTQHVGRRVERKDIDGRIAIGGAILRAMNPLLSLRRVGAASAGTASIAATISQPSICIDNA